MKGFLKNVGLFIGIFAISFSVFFVLDKINNRDTLADAATELKLIQPQQKTVGEEQPTRKAEKDDPKLIDPKRKDDSTVQYHPEKQAQKKSLILVGDYKIPYGEGGYAEGQAIIDADPNVMGSTWGGKTPYSGTDNLNTHFIGHHVGAFDPFIDLQVGGKITIVDDSGNSFTYIVKTTTIVDTKANDVKTGKNLFSEITSTGGGERVVFQTCTSETERKILFAFPS
ncbi:MAG: sortase [Streptococcaceae bacterium]|jgi:hypothetical protein|nr:sortase [Streptococcaceae bacterium]